MNSFIKIIKLYINFFILNFINILIKEWQLKNPAYLTFVHYY